MVLQRILGLEEESKYVRTELERTNRGILRYEAVFLTTISALALASTWLQIIPWANMTKHTIMFYRGYFFCICAASIVCNRCCAALSESTEDTGRQTRAVLFVYTTVLMMLSTAITTYDYTYGRSLFYYLLAIFFVYGILYIKPLITIINNVLFATVLIIALRIIDGGANALTFVRLIFYVFIAVVISISNYQARRQAAISSERIFDLARHDELTKTKNRRAVDEDGKAALGHATYVLLGDIDDFKFYNDSFGHNRGDELLCALAQSMCKAFGKDNIYRFGGDEFLAIVCDVEEAQFLEMIDQWRTDFNSVEVSNQQYTPTTSAGFVMGTPKTTSDIQTMLRLADIRLYDAKQAGRNKALGMTFTADDDAYNRIDAEHLLARRSGNLDPLTGLPSMTSFLQHGNSYIASPRLAGASFHLVYFNVDNMKAYNARHGMTKGDDLLVFIAQAIEQAFPEAISARVGDDRFALLTHGDTVIDSVKEVYEAVHGYQGGLGAVIRAGIYNYEAGMDLNTACDLAKLACDHIKDQRNIYYFVYNNTLREAHERKQWVLDHFEYALAEGHIQAYYQPIIRSISGRVSDFEALARWIDPQEGLIPPADFIPVLEEYRIVHLLDLAIVECVCRDIHTHANEGYDPLPVNVNLSRYDIELCDIAGAIKELIERYDIEPYMINIEITESAFAESTDLLREVIARFHEMGMQVWMDDFGSGYSSLNILREFDFDVVKLDMVFLQHRDRISLERARMMVPHLINMIKELGIQTLVEGVETERQRTFLIDAGCEKLQGFAFSKPLPIDEARSILAGSSIEAETPNERMYYDPIGQVNLASPVSIDAELAHSIELSGGMPAAIVEFRNGRISYLQWNSSYLDYLHDIGINTIENSAKQINDLSRPQSQEFFKAADYLRDKSEWLNMSFYEGENFCTGMARCVAVDDASGASAYLYIAFNVSQYLARAGLAST